MLYNKAKRYKSKYNIIKKGDKVKFYYTADDSVFAFLPNEFPLEFAPKMDIDLQFEKMVLEPLNRIIAASGYPKVSGALTYSAGLW
jgi:predicted HAD superfamily hydrolase